MMSELLTNPLNAHLALARRASSELQPACPTCSVVKWCSRHRAGLLTPPCCTVTPCPPWSPPVSSHLLPEALLIHPSLSFSGAFLWGTHSIRVSIVCAWWLSHPPSGQCTRQGGLYLEHFYNLSTDPQHPIGAHSVLADFKLHIWLSFKFSVFR